MWEYLNTKNRSKRSGGHEFLLELQRNLEEIGREHSIPEETFVLIWAAAVSLVSIRIGFKVLYLRGLRLMDDKLYGLILRQLARPS